jgi:hypothetical protein
LIRDVAEKLAPNWVPRIFVLHSCEKIKREDGNDNKDVHSVDEILAVPDTNILIVNTDLTKIKITVVINLRAGPVMPAPKFDCQVKTS